MVFSLRRRNCWEALLKTIAQQETHAEGPFPSGETDQRSATSTTHIAQSGKTEQPSVVCQSGNGPHLMILLAHSVDGTSGQQIKRITVEVEVEVRAEMQ